MKELSKYLVEQCRSAQVLKVYNIKNRLNTIEFDTFFKRSNVHMVNNRLIEITPTYRQRKNASLFREDWCEITNK